MEDCCYTASGRTGREYPAAVPPYVKAPPQVPAPHPDQIPGQMLPPVGSNPAPGPDDIPVAPLPPIVGNPAPPSPDDTPVVPLPPIVGNPAPPSPDDTPVVPLPPIVGNPAPPNGDQIPIIPLPPIVGNPEPPFQPQPPAAPGYPPVIVPNLCTVRFLNAASGYDPLRVTIGNRLAAGSLRFGSMSPYYRVADGFRLVTIFSALMPRKILFQQSVPFRAGELITLAILRTNAGLDLLRISDMPCNNLPWGRGCVRAVNLCYQAPALDVLLADGRMVFSDVRFKEVTQYRQARPQEYSFYVAQTSYLPTPYFDDIETFDDAPMAASNYYLPGYGDVTPLVNFYISVKNGGMYTIYMLGHWNGYNGVRVKVTEDFY